MFSCCFTSKKLIKVYKEGQNRLEKEFDISKIIINLRNVSLYLKERVLDDPTKFEIKHNYKAVIYDESSSE